MADSNVEVKLNNVRLSFFNGFTPQERTNDDKKVTGYNFNTAILIDKTTQQDLIKKVQEGMVAARTAKWGESNPPKIPAERRCLREGEREDPDTGKVEPLYDGYAGQMVLTANKSVKIEDYEAIKAGKKPRPVKIIGPRKNAEGKFVPLEEDHEFAPYSGCYANVIVRIYGYDGTKDENPNRINASLEAVQFYKHGERFAGAAPVDVDSEFDDVDGYDDFSDDKPAASSGAPDDGDDLLG